MHGSGTQQDLKSLDRELRSLSDDLPGHSLPDVFVLWFVLAYITGDTAQAQKTLMNGANDKGVDAIHVDSDRKVISIVQSKYITAERGAASAKDVVQLSDLARLLRSDPDEFREFLAGASPRVARELKKARRLVANKYQLRLCFVASGSVSKAAGERATKAAERHGDDFEIFDRRRVLRLLSDYVVGVAPIVAREQIAITGSGHITSEDKVTGVSAFVATVAARELVRLYENHGERIFARNVRGYLGAQGNEVNRSIIASARSDPKLFWYLNNGVTIACEEAELNQRGSRHSLILASPQIINGQQTTRSLAECDDVNGIQVLVRVVIVPDRSERLIARIVRATNHQTAIKIADLRANDERQVSLERKLRSRHYIYLRKQQSRGEVRAIFGRSWPIISRDEIARAVAACDLDPSLARRGANVLFSDDYYSQVFPDRAIGYFLARHLLCRLIREQLGRKDPIATYAQFFIAAVVWRSIEGRVDPKRIVTVIEHGDQHPTEHKALIRLVKASTRASLSFFSHTRGAGESRVEFYAFFKRPGQYERFVSYRSKLPPTVRSELSRARDRCVRELRASV